MLKVLALGAHKELHSIQNQLEEDGIELTTAYFTSVRVEIIDNCLEIYVNDIKINNYDFVWLKSSWANRQMANAIAVFLNENQIPHTEIELEKSKLVDNIYLANRNINIPNTFFSNTKSLERNIGNIERVCKYPVIVKITRGSLGKGIFLADSREELVNIFAKDIKKSRQYYCQEFVPNEFDYRVIVSGQEKVLSAEKRTRQGDEFRNNAHLGAKEEFLDVNELDEDLINISINSAKALDLNWTGIDIVKSTVNNKYYILELNRRPGLTLESTEVAAAYDHIISLLESRGLYLES